MGGRYLDGVAALLESCDGRRVLELGSGTGNNTAALAKRVPCSITALEPSGGMVAQAGEKGVPGRWTRGCATALPFADSSFDFLFAVYVLHHIQDLRVLARECFRVLGEGRAAFVTAPGDFIVRHPMNRYFPSFAKVDLARFQPVEEVEAALHDAGFSAVGTERHEAPPIPIDAAYLEKVAGKFISTYDLIPEEEYTAGLERLRADVGAQGKLEQTLTWEAATVWAQK